MARAFPATVVLVHGAWHGSWCWDDVVAGLRARGIVAVAVDLPSRSGQGSVAVDAAFVRAVIEGIDGRVVVCGHSYGGCVITGAAAGLSSVTHLVYLAALMIDAGESAMQSVGVDIAPGSTDLEHALVVGDDGAIRIDPDVAVAAFYADASAEQAAAAIVQLTPQPAGTLGETVTAAAWHDIPSTYVVCTDDRAIPPVVQRALATRATNVVEWPTSHSPFLSRPDLVVDLLAGTAG
jgi:pimeloyl-ACP methyl ester carboxylesterase